MNKNLSYVNLDDNTAKVTCPCGWETAAFRRGPFDPAEALIAFQVEHLECLPIPVVVTYYTCAQEIHGKLTLLGDLMHGPEAKETMEKACKALAPKGKTMHVVEIKVVSSWEG